MVSVREQSSGEALQGLAQCTTVVAGPLEVGTARATYRLSPPPMIGTLIDRRTLSDSQESRRGRMIDTPEIKRNGNTR